MISPSPDSAPEPGPDEPTIPLTLLRRIRVGAPVVDHAVPSRPATFAGHGIDVDVDVVDGQICEAAPPRGTRRMRFGRANRLAAPRPLTSLVSPAGAVDIVCMRLSRSVATSDPRLRVDGAALWIVVPELPDSATDDPAPTLLMRHRRGDSATTPEREFAAMRAAGVDGVVMSVRDWNRATASMAHRFGLLAVADNATRAEHIADAAAARLDAISWAGTDVELERLRS